MPVDGDLGHNLAHTGLTADVLALQTDVTDPTVTGIQRGILTATAISGTTTTAVVFPVAYPGGVIPVVVACLKVSVLTGRAVGVLNITNTGFDLNLLSTSTTGVPVLWIAVSP